MHRTTINIPDAMMPTARIKALREGTTLSEVLRDLLARWVSGAVSLPCEPGGREKMVALARAPRGMWADRDADALLAASRAGMKERDEELARARLDG